jgi:signal transduction histidine kinase
LTAVERETLESVGEEVDRLSRMVDDLLTIASADEGRLALSTEPVDLLDLAAVVVRGLSHLAERQEVELVTAGDTVLALGDAERLRHAVRNLVENAIKFSRPGDRVEIATRVGLDGHAQISVSDSGPGVPADLRERIFERFFRADVSRARGSGGSGLGLAIAREIVLAHSGRVWVEPRDGGGSVFTIELPALAAPGETASADAEALHDVPAARRAGPAVGVAGADSGDVEPG